MSKRRGFVPTRKMLETIVVHRNPQVVALREALMSLLAVYEHSGYFLNTVPESDRRVVEKCRDVLEATKLVQSVKVKERCDDLL